MQKKVKKGLDIAAIVLVCIIFLLGVMLLSLAVTKNKDGVPRVFGVTFLDIQTDSMAAGEDPIFPADIAVITKVKEVSQLKVGDVVTFWDTIDGKMALNTHRITRIVANENPEFTIFYTKGDNVAVEDGLGKTLNMIVGKYQFRMPGFGHVTRFLQSGLGFFFVIILPLLAFLGYRIFILVKVVLSIKKEKALEEAGKEQDAEKLKAELEILREKVKNLDENKLEPKSDLKD